MIDLTAKSVFVLLAVCLADVASANWTTVGGMNLSYVPQPTTPVYDWPYNGAGPDGPTVSYGAFTWPGNGGTHAGLLTVDNSVGSFDAYITQTIDLTGATFGPGAYTVPGGGAGQQFVNWVNPSDGNGSAAIWMELDYGNGQFQNLSPSTATTAWKSTYMNMAFPAIPPTELTIKIGIVKDPAVNTGTRSLMLEDVLLSTFFFVQPLAGQQYYPQWDNFNFDKVPEPATLIPMCLGGIGLLVASRRCNKFCAKC